MHPQNLKQGAKIGPEYIKMSLAACQTQNMKLPLCLIFLGVVSSANVIDSSFLKASVSSEEVVSSAEPSTSATSSAAQDSTFLNLVELSVNSKKADEALSNFFQDVSDAMKKKDANDKALAQNSSQNAINKLLEEPDYEYVNVYNCKGLSVQAHEDIAKQPYGCYFEAFVSYIVTTGKVADKNVTGVINDIKNYQNCYDKYLKTYQLQIFSVWAMWYKGNFGSRYYSCSGKNGIQDAAKCEKIKAKGAFKIGDTIHVENAYIPADKKDDAVIAMSNYWNTPFQVSDLDQVSRDNMDLSDTGSNMDDVTIKNVTGPKVMNMIPNPMLNVTNKNVTDMRKLISFLETNLYKQSAQDLFDMLSPVQMYISLSGSISNIRTVGDAELKQEAKEKKMMILNIVLLIVGVFSMVLGPEMLVAIDSAVAIASLAGSYAITGKISAGDMILTLVGAFAGGLRGVALGLKLKEVANNFRYARSMDKFCRLMKAIPSYLDPMQIMYGLSYHGSNT